MTDDAEHHFLFQSALISLIINVGKSVINIIDFTTSNIKISFNSKVNVTTN